MYWIIKVQFKDGTWYRGVLESRVEELTARKILLRNFKELFPDYEIRRRGGGTFKIFYSTGRTSKLVRVLPKPVKKEEPKIETKAKPTVEPEHEEQKPQKKSMFETIRRKLWH